MPSRKNILKNLDYDTLQIKEVNFLPPRFDGNHMFNVVNTLPFVLLFGSWCISNSPYNSIVLDH